MDDRGDCEFHRCAHFCRNRLALSCGGWFLQDIFSLLSPLFCVHGQLDNCDQQCRGHCGVAIMGAEYIAPVLLPSVAHGTAIQVVTVTSVVVLYIINMIGIRVSARFLNVLMLIKLSMLALLILSVFFVRGGHAADVNAVHVATPADMFKAFAMCFIPVFFSYGGYQQTMNFGNDIPNANRTMPRAIFYGISIVLIVYLSVNYSYYKVLGFDTLKHSTTIASDISGLIFGAVAFKLVSVIMFLSVMAYVNVSW